MLTAGQNHNVKFKVNVMGTSAEPRVRVILGTVPELSFAANKDADDWITNLSVPSHISSGDYELRVEVHLNNRLFTPIRKNINVKGFELPEPLQAAKIPPEPGAVPVLVKSTERPEIVKPEPSVFKNIARTSEPDKIVAPEMPRVQVKLPKVELKNRTNESIAKSIMSEPQPALSALSTIAKSPAKKRFEAISSGMPSKVPTAKPITVRISEIDAVTTSEVQHVIEACKPIKADRKMKKSSTVKLVKEELFYE